MIHSSHEVAERACKLGFCAPSTGQIQGIPYRLDGFIPEGSVIYASIVTPNECYWAIHKFIFERKQLQHLSRKTGTYVHQHWTCTIHYNTVVNTLAIRRIADFKLLSARHVKKWYLGYCCWWCKYMFPCIYIYISYTYIYIIYMLYVLNHRPWLERRCRNGKGFTEKNQRLSGCAFCTATSTAWACRRCWRRGWRRPW